MMLHTNRHKYPDLLTHIQSYADRESTCLKVAVGALLVDGDYLDSFEFSVFNPNSDIAYIPGLYGCNASAVKQLSCKSIGCLRMQKYGEQCKEHRNPEDCRSVHSEIQVISRAASLGMVTDNKVVIVTRYPCEACAKAIIKAGISTVIYGREQKISEQTAEMFKLAGIEVVHVPEWIYKDRTD